MPSAVADRAVTRPEERHDRRVLVHAGLARQGDEVPILVGTEVDVIRVAICYLSMGIPLDRAGHFCQPLHIPVEFRLYLRFRGWHIVVTHARK